MLEIDVRLSRDGHLVVVHDETLDRTCDAKDMFSERNPRHVEDFTLSELKTLDFGSWFVRDDPFGAIAAHGIPAWELNSFRGIQISTLQEILEFVLAEGWLINVEIKDLRGLAGDRDIAEKTVALINLLGAGDRVLISSFNHDYLTRIKRLDASIPTGALVSRPPRDALEMMRRLDATTYNPSVRAYRPWDVKKLKDHGFSVLVWVVNKPAIARLLFRSGIDGVFTDYPERLNNAD
jgi:glycerophosphoryl diester phosphodiesterase